MTLVCWFHFRLEETKSIFRMFLQISESAVYGFELVGSRDLISDALCNWMDDV